MQVTELLVLPSSFAGEPPQARAPQRATPRAAAVQLPRGARRVPLPHRPRRAAARTPHRGARAALRRADRATRRQATSDERPMNQIFLPISITYLLKR